MKKITLAFLPLLLLGAAGAQAQLGAYLPEPGQWIVSASYQYQRYDSFWLGGTSIDLDVATGFHEQRQHSTYLTFEYAFCPRFALDATVGYSWTEFHDGPPGVADLTDDGLTDTSIGARFLLVDERVTKCSPTVTLRVGGIIPGTYNDAFPFSVGDGAAGVEVAALFARQICTGFGLYGEFGYRWRDHDVPEELFGAAGATMTYRGVSLSTGYRQSESTHGPDIGDPGFGTKFGFPQTREIDKRIEASLGYSDPGGRYYALYYARTFDGRNTGQKDVFGVTISIPFGGKGEPLPPPGRYGKK